MHFKYQYSYIYKIYLTFIIDVFEMVDLLIPSRPRLNPPAPLSVHSGRIHEDLMGKPEGKHQLSRIDNHNIVFFS